MIHTPSICIYLSQVINIIFLTDIAKILREIILNFHIHPTVSLLRTHILPYMKGDMNHMLVTLRSCLVSYPNALNAILLHSLSKSNIQEAVNFSKSMQLYIYCTLCRISRLCT